MADDIRAEVVEIMGRDNGLKLYIHRERGTEKLLAIELVDRRNNHVYLEPGDGEVLRLLSTHVPK